MICPKGAPKTGPYRSCALTNRAIAGRKPKSYGEPGGMTARTSASLGSPIHASGVFSLATPASTAPRAPIATGLTPRARLRHTRAPAGRGGRHMATATVDSIELYYEEHGRGDPLLLIMGLAADSTAWLFQVPDFAERYRTITFDNRGVGRSSKPPGPYTIHQMADDAAGLLDALRVARAHVLGVSMGGMIAQELALRHPERVRGLVLACTYPEPDVEAERQREFGIGQFGGTVTASGEMRIDLSALDPLMFFQHLLPRVFNQSFLDRELPRLMQLSAGALHYGFSMHAILGQVAAVMGHKATDRLHLIAAPTLVITGDADLLISPANPDLLARSIPGAKLVKVAGGSHGFNFETPEIFNRAVLDFLAGVPWGSTGRRRSSPARRAASGARPRSPWRAPAPTSRSAT